MTVKTIELSKTIQTNKILAAGYNAIEVHSAWGWGMDFDQMAVDTSSAWMTLITLRNGLRLQLDSNDDRCHADTRWRLSRAWFEKTELDVRGPIIYYRGDIALTFTQANYDYREFIEHATSDELTELSAMLLLLTRDTIVSTGEYSLHRSIELSNNHIRLWNNSIREAVNRLDVVITANDGGRERKHLAQNLIKLACWDAIEGLLIALMRGSNK